MRAWRDSGRQTPYARDGESETPDACTVFVGNLPYEVTWQDLKDHMAQAGEVAHADVKSGPDGRSKGVGIVRYHSAEDAATAIQSLSETDLGGRNILVRADRGGAAGGVVRAVGGRDAGGRVGRRDAPYARGNESEAPDACTVFVGNLPYEVTWQDLKDHMAQAGEVAHADVKSGPDGRSKGVGIVRYHSADDAATAIESLSETNLGGRNILVRADGGGGRGGAPGRGGGRGGRGVIKGGGRFGKSDRQSKAESAPVSATALDDDLNSYMGRGGATAKQTNGTAQAKKGKGGRGEKSATPTGGGLDDDLDAYFSAKKSSGEAAMPDAAPAAE